MPYVANERISDDEFPGSIKVSAARGAEIIAAMVEGKRLEVHGKTVVLVDPAAPAAPDPGPSAEEVRRRLVLDIKHEAQTRIYAVMSDIEQRNALAEQQAFILAFGADPNFWPVEAAKRGVEMLDAWTEIARIRQRSNEIEALDPIPSDFTDDKHWS